MAGVMKAKWFLLFVLLLLVIVAASVMWNRQDKLSTMASVPLPNAVDPPSVAMVKTLEVATTPLMGESEGEEATQPEPVKYKAGEPSIPPPVPNQFPEPAAPQMGWAAARYDIEGRIVAPGNRFGQMALVHVLPGARISASLKWPKAVPGAAVAVEVVDGGRLEGGQLSQMLRVDERGEIEFRYTANRQPGRCQVVVRCGMDETALCFWVVDETAKNIPAGL